MGLLSQYSNVLQLPVPYSCDQGLKARFEEIKNPLFELCANGGGCVFWSF